jgi:hypothetical protein
MINLREIIGVSIIILGGGCLVMRIAEVVILSARIRKNKCRLRKMLEEDV